MHTVSYGASCQTPLQTPTQGAGIAAATGRQPLAAAAAAAAAAATLPVVAADSFDLHVAETVAVSIAGTAGGTHQGWLGSWQTAAV